LARESAARAEYAKDGRVVFILEPMTFQKKYRIRKFVAEQVSKLGRNHPMVKTQYYSEEIDAECGMFPESRLIDAWVPSF
jgi:hypothetical protein